MSYTNKKSVSDQHFKNFVDASSFIKKNGAPIVVKADGLAAGKGVFVCNSIEEALKYSKEILEGKFKSSNQVILEEFLNGEELSYFVIVDQNSYKFFGSAQDHKRVGEKDIGPPIVVDGYKKGIMLWTLNRDCPSFTQHPNWTWTETIHQNLYEEKY